MTPVSEVDAGSPRDGIALALPGAGHSALPSYLYVVYREHSRAENKAVNLATRTALSDI